jgi:hypothetical protein
MNGGLDQSRNEKPVCKRVGDAGPRCHHGQGHEASEDWKSLNAIRVSSRKPPQEGRKTCVVRRESIGGDAAAQYEMRAQDLHPCEQ